VNILEVGMGVIFSVFLKFAEHRDIRG